MTNSADAIAAFLTKGGKVRKVSTSATCGMTARQWHKAARDPEPVAKVIEVLPYPGEGIHATLTALLAPINWTNTRQHFTCHRHMANTLMLLKENLTADKDTWLETNVSYWRQHSANALWDASKVFWDADYMSDETFDAINSLYGELTNSKMRLL